MVDYCIVAEENMGLIGNFKVTTMNESIEEMEWFHQFGRVVLWYQYQR